MDTGDGPGRIERVEQVEREAKRNSAIDVMRGAAVLSVILLHVHIRIPFDSWAPARHLPKPLYQMSFWSGYYGVIVFFVVSGFLITRRISERWGTLEDVAVGPFYRRRFARIAPLLVLFVAVQSVLQSAGVSGFSEAAPAASLARSIFSALTFHLNLLEAKVGYLPGAWDVLWSLCVEELFYLGYPLVIRVAKPRVVLYAVLVVFAIIGPFARVSPGSNEMWQDHSYLSCMGEIAIGCLAAAIAGQHPPSKKWAAALLGNGAGLMLLVLYFRNAVAALGLYALGLNVTFLSLGTAAVLVAVTSVPSWTRLTDHAAFYPLRLLGKNSYEVYLSHLFVVLPVTLLWKRAGGAGWTTPLFYLAAISLSAGLGALLAKLYSQPLDRRLRGARDPATS